MPDWLAFILLSAPWIPVLVLLHESAHAFAALALTDGEVSISMRGAGVLGGSVSYEPASLRHPRDEAWIAASGPAATFLGATVLWLAWVAGRSDSLATVVGVGATIASVICRVLTGAPPGGIERELRRVGERERAIRPAIASLLVLIGALALWVDPVVGLWLVAIFGAAALLQRSDAGR